jgi:hypothetical protein
MDTSILSCCRKEKYRQKKVVYNSIYFFAIVVMESYELQKKKRNMQARRAMNVQQ